MGGWPCSHFPTETFQEKEQKTVKMGRSPLQFHVPIPFFFFLLERRKAKKVSGTNSTCFELFFP